MTLRRGGAEAGPGDAGVTVTSDTVHQGHIGIGLDTGLALAPAPLARAETTGADSSSALRQL
jgi:hypothetical protein